MRIKVAQTQKQPLQILKPPLVAMAGGLISISGVLIVWSLSARIPEIINGIGTLTPLDSVFSVLAPSGGAVLYPIQKIKSQYRYRPPLWSQRAFAYLDEPAKIDDVEVYKLIEEVIESITIFDSERFPIDSANIGMEGEGEDYTLGFNTNDVIAVIDNSALKGRLQGSLVKLTRSISLYERARVFQNKSLRYKSNILPFQKEMLDIARRLEKQGYVSKQDVLEREISFGAAKSEQSTLVSQLNEIERQIALNKAELRDALSDFLRSSVIFANASGRIDHFVVPQWSEVQPGEEIMALSWTRRVKPSTIPVFVTPNNATLVRAGNQAIATPSGFSIAEIGGIKGVVTSIDNQPLTPDQLGRRLGSRGLSQSIGVNGGYQVNIKLERDSMKDTFKGANNRGGYLWNNRSNPPIPPREGMLLNVQITTRKRTPLEMLIPAAREVLGLEEPRQFKKIQTGL